MTKRNIPSPPSKSNKIPKPPDSFNLDYRKPQNIIGLNNEGRIPPNAVDLEQVVLGALLIDKSAILEIANFMKREFFYKDSHKVIFQAISKLYDQGVPIDLLIVIEELRKNNDLIYIGGESYLVDLCNKVSSSAHIDFHCRIIIQKYVLRELIKTSTEVKDLSYHSDPDIFSLMEKVSNDIDRIYRDAIIKDNSSDSSDAKAELKSKRDKVLKGENVGYKVGISEFDDWCGGFLPRELITIAARPGMGKTTIGLAMMCNSSLNHNISTAFFSLEMSQIDVKNRIASRLTGIKYSKIRMAELTNEEYLAVLEAFDYIDKSNLSVHDILEHGNKLLRIIKKIRKLVANGVRMIYIDYLQLIKLNKATSDRTGELNIITRELKALSNELNIPIIEFAQLNRGVDSRPGHIPTLADLKQSGSIEEDSDTVIFIVRDAYYQSVENSGIEIPPHIAGETKFIVAKGRSIGTRSFKVMLDFLRYTVSS